MSKATELIRERIAEIDAEVNPQLAKIQHLIDEKEELLHDVRRIERGNTERRRQKAVTAGTGSPTAQVSDERVIEVLRSLGAPARSPQVATELSVPVQAVSRQLTRMARENTILGDKDSGYSPMPLVDAVGPPLEDAGAATEPQDGAPATNGESAGLFAHTG